MVEQRSQLIIKQHFQQSMILQVMLVTFIMINLIVIIGYLLIDSILDVQQLKRYLAFSVAGLEIIGFIFVYRLNVKSSHRIAGPVYVIERSLKSIEAGDLSFTMRLRKNDQFHEVKDQMNLTLTKLKQHIGTAQQLAGQLQKSSHPDLLLVDQLVDQLSYFKIEEVAKHTGQTALTDKKAA